MANWYKCVLPIKGVEAETQKAYLIKVEPDYNYLSYSLGMTDRLTEPYFFWISKKLVKYLSDSSLTMLYTSGWNWNFAPKKGKKLDIDHSIDCNLKQLQQCLTGAHRA